MIGLDTNVLARYYIEYPPQVEAEEKTIGFLEFVRLSQKCGFHVR